MPNKSKKATHESSYYVKGMHCAACEVLIEKSLLKENGVTFADASTEKGIVKLIHDGQKPNIRTLNEKLAEHGYEFFTQKPKEVNTPTLRIENGQLHINNQKFKNFSRAFVIALILIVGFLNLNKNGITSWMAVSSTSALSAFFIFGVLAGLSTCAALVGGIVLSMSKQWSELYKTDNTFAKLQPHLLFNSGRLVSYTLLGGALGAVGSIFKFSLSFSAAITILVSILMIGLAFQMLGVKAFRKFQLKMPKALTNFAADETNFKAKHMPFFMGALTFFLPCGFTITAQSIAIASGSAVQGALIMLFFALGTLPSLLLIGISSIEFLKKPHLSNSFQTVAGILILFFGLFNINAQLNVIGVPSLSDLEVLNKPTVQAADGFIPMVDGKQIMKMDAFAYGYEPNYFKVKPNIPVSFEITDNGTSGCTNAVISQDLFEGQIKLTPGTTSVKEFTPTEEGRFKFSCWMGMVSGIIDVSSSGDIAALPSDNGGAAGAAPSGATGCGCGSTSCTGGK